MDYSYRFPVVRGIQAHREYYIAMVPLKLISRLFPSDEEYVLPEFRAQRKLNESRIPVIKRYILENRDNYVFSALAASIDGKFNFKADAENDEVGILEISMDAKFLINDGQHRKAAILEALTEDPTLQNETISIVFFADQDLTRAQQIFTDLNKNAVRTSNSLSELYDSRDILAVITRKVIDQNEFLNSYTDKEKDNLGKYSSNLFTFHKFYTASRSIFSHKKPQKRTAAEAEQFLKNFWDEVVKNMVQWDELYKHEIFKVEVRENYISTQGIVIQAFGYVGNYFYGHHSKKMSVMLAKLRTINWKRSDPQWLHRAIREDGRILTNKKAVVVISNIIKMKIGVPLSNDEKAVEVEFEKTYKK